MANSRVIEFIRELANMMNSQRDRGSSFLIGDSITAVDFFWAAFSNFISIQPAHICPINPAARPMFENTTNEITSAIDPILIEHRDFMMDNYFKLPLEL